MTNRQRVVLAASVVAAVLGIQSRAQQVSPEVASIPAPAAAQQNTSQRAPACVARCAGVRDNRLADAARRLSAREYYSSFSSNCPEDPGQPKCATLRQACREACGPKYENTCMAACQVPFQSCCHANDTVLAGVRFSECVAECPAEKPGAAPRSETLPSPATPAATGGPPAAGGLTAAAWQASAVQQRLQSEAQLQSFITRAN